MVIWALIGQYTLPLPNRMSFGVSSDSNLGRLGAIHKGLY